MHTKYSLFVLLLIGLTCTGMSHAHQCRTWTPCECDNQEYTLTLHEIPAFFPGTFKRSPDKPTYKKGETVYVQYTPAEGRILKRWESSRPSHFSIEENGEITALFITGDTTLTAWTIPEKVHLWVNWNENFGDVTLPPGADPFYSSFTVYVDYNDTITLTATPAGNNVMTYWEYRDFRRYGNEITLKPREDLNIEVGFRSSIPSSSINIVTPSGYADVFCNGLYADSAIGYAPFGYMIEPKHGYVVQYVHWQENGQTHYTTSTGANGRPAGTYTAQMSKWITLNLETEGEGVVTSPEYVGFKPGWNPQPYQTDGTSLSPSIHSGLLIMRPDACPGWEFDHWEYKDASGQWVTANLQTTDNNLAVHMNWWTCPDDGIWHLHVPNGDYTFDAKAVFVKDCPCGPECYPADCNLNTSEMAMLQTCFPNMRLCNVYKTGEATGDPSVPGSYNCIAFVGRETRWVWPEIDKKIELGGYGDGDGRWEYNEFVNYFNARGVTDYLIYGFSMSDVKHAARFNGTCAESKLGGDIQILHDPQEMEGGIVYGNLLP